MLVLAGMIESLKIIILPGYIPGKVTFSPHGVPSVF